MFLYNLLILITCQQLWLSSGDMRKIRCKPMLSSVAVEKPLFNVYLK